MYNIKKEMEKKAGFKLSTVKEYRMMEKILYEKGFFVSYSTLYRMFSVSKNHIQPRTETLNLLSRFLGYTNYEQFEGHYQLIDRNRESFFSKEIEFKALLFNNDFKGAIELYEGMKDEPSEFLNEFAHILGKQIFNREKINQKEFEYFLNSEVKAPYFLEFFVYEDDPFGHFQWAIENLDSKSAHATEKELYTLLYSNRKKILKGEVCQILEIDEKDLNFHLLARYFELNLLNEFVYNKKGLQKYVLEKTNEIIHTIESKSNEYEKLVLIGRWNRALIFTNTYPYLKGQSEWRQLSLTAFNSSIENLEFKAPIYAFLKLTYSLVLPLDFYKYNRWENAVLESQLLLSKALGNQKAVESYKKILKINLEI